MHITLNGKPQELPGDMAPLTAVLEYFGFDAQGKGIAAAVNGAVVPKAQWTTYMVQSNDQLEIIRAWQGG